MWAGFIWLRLWSNGSLYIKHSSIVRNKILITFDLNEGMQPILMFRHSSTLLMRVKNYTSILIVSCFL